MASFHQFRLTPAGHVDLPFGLDLPNPGLRLIARTTGSKTRGELGSGKVLLVQQGASSRWCHRLYRTPDLSARRWLLVDDQNGKAMSPQPNRCAHSGRARAHHHRIKGSHDATFGRPS